MKFKSIAVLGLSIACIVACGQQTNKKSTAQQKTKDDYQSIGDSTIYGLACEGCNDSVIVLLPNDGSDPITYDVVDARRNKRILGDIQIGDWIGIVANRYDKRVADEVVNLDQLKGIWCYVVMPKMRDYEYMSKSLQRRMMRDMPDSVKRTYLIPREYGFWLRRQWGAQSVGYVSEQSALEQESPVVYPQLGYFTGWRIWNGKVIILSATPIFKNDNTIQTIDPRIDTCDIVYLGNDSLVLSSEGASRSYYRKKDINDVNVKARYMAEKLKREALKKTTQEG